MTNASGERDWTWRQWSAPLAEALLPPFAGHPSLCPATVHAVVVTTKLRRAKPWPLPVPRRSAAQVRAEARRILAEPQFQHQPSLLQRFINWLTSHLGLSHVGVPRLGAHALGYVVVGALALLAISVLVLAFTRGGWARLRHPAPPGVLVTDAGPLLPPEAWEAEAERLAAAGLHREALRCRYRALVAHVARWGLVQEEPGRTSGDYARLVTSSAPEVGPDFAAATTRFETAWYGGEQPSPAALRAFDDAARAVLGRIGPRRHRTTAPAALAGRR